MDLLRERQPDPGLEERVVSALIADGLIRPRRPRRVVPRTVWLAAAAVLILALGVSWWRMRSIAGRGDTYVLMLYEDSTYQFDPPGHSGEQRAEMARWADSLAHLGKLDLGGQVMGSRAPGGLFIIRAKSDDEAERIAASCPHHKYGGHVELHRFAE